MSPTSFDLRQPRADAISQSLMARFVAPLFPESTFPPAEQLAQAHQRAVNPSPIEIEPDSAFQVSQDTSKALFAERYEPQVVKVWKKVQSRAQQQQAAATQPRPYQLADLLDQQAVTAKRGKGAKTTGLWDYAQMVYEVAQEQYRALGCECLPCQMTIFTSVELWAEARRVQPSTIYRWNKLLEALGFLQARPHKGTSLETRQASAERRAKAKAQALDAGELGAATPAPPATKRPRKARRDTVTDGTLYAIRFRPDHHAKLHIEDFKHEYRNLDADRQAGRTAHAIIKDMRATAEAQPSVPVKMQGSLNPRRSEWFLILRKWAVRDFYLDDPLEDDPCILADLELRSVDDVIEAVTLIAEVHPTKRNALIGFLAGGLTRIFGDSAYHRAYCKLLWQAWYAETQGRPAFQMLQAQLSRVKADRHDWAALRKPGALLMSRMAG
ncbi:hypothetical protein Dxin01_03583 [Deinococcus xinjiangensis]|uniref:Replication protein n=1 Tax=Deinococcus xinjiangensis TaxID=457454 RepID=A0ABP9VF21_9DEIO